MSLPPDQDPLSKDSIPAPEAGAAGTPGEAAMGRPPEAAPRWLRQLRGWRDAPAWLFKLVEQDKDALSAIDLETPLVGRPPAQPEGAGPAVPTEAVPSWLQDLRPAEGAAPPEQAAEATVVQPPQEPVPDWLTDLERSSEGAAGGESPPAPGAEETPEWLSQLEAEPGSKPEEGPTAATPEQQVPDWLSRLEPTPTTIEQEATPAFAEGEIPDWLENPAEVTEQWPQEELSLGPTEAEEGQELPVPEEEPPAGAKEPTAFTDTEMPEWLGEFDQASPLQGIEGEPTGQINAELSGWLDELEQGLEQPAEKIEIPREPQDLQAPATPAEEVSPATPVEEPNLPDWLQGLEVPTAGQPAQRRSVTDWLSGVEEMPAPRSKSPQPAMESEPEPETGPEPVVPEAEAGPEAPVEPAVPEPEEQVEAPQWLQESMSAEGPGQPEEAPTGEKPTAAPAWLSELAPAKEPAEAEILPELSESQMPPADEVPTWLEELRAQEVQAKPEGEGGATAVETSGPLAGLTGLLNPEPLLGIFPKSTYKPMAPVPDAHLAEAKLLEQILAEPAARPAVPSRKPARQVMHSLGRWIMYAALVAAVIAAAFVPDLQGLVQTPDIPEVKDLYTVISGLPAQGRVLLALDYDASLDGELTPQVRAILWHALRQGLGVAAVSLTPQGTAIVQQLYESDAADISAGGRYAWGESFINLGYLPPYPASLQAFMSNPLAGASYGGIPVPLEPGQKAPTGVLQTPLAQRIKTFDDLDLIVVISGNQDHVRWWIEQVGSQHPVRIVAGVSAAIAPYLQPYYSQGGAGQLKGMLPGLAGAAAFETLAGAQFSPSARENLILQGYAQAVLVVIVLLGGLSAVFGTSRGK